MTLFHMHHSLRVITNVKRSIVGPSTIVKKTEGGPLVFETMVSFSFLVTHVEASIPL